MTNNNQNYERPAIELMFVESEAGFCQSQTTPRGGAIDDADEIDYGEF